MMYRLLIFFLSLPFSNSTVAQTISISNDKLNQIDTVISTNQKTTYTYDATHNIVNKKVEVIGNSIDITNNGLQLTPNVISNNIPFIVSGSLQFTLQNNLPTCKLGFYFSTDNVLDGADVFLGDTILNNTAANSVVNYNNLNLLITPNPTVGNYYIISKVDYNNAIAETNENNNVQAAAITAQNCNSFTVTINTITQPSCGLNNGSITVTPTGVGYTYSINQTNQYQASNNFTNLSAGNYTVYVKNPLGCIAFNTINLTNSNGSLPICAFSYTQNNNVITFNNLTQGATSYVWNFGNGVTSSQLNPIYTYPNSGNYLVTLSATNSCGTITTQQNVNIVINGCFSFAQIVSNKPVNIIDGTPLIFSVSNPTNYNNVIWNDSFVGSSRQIYNAGNYYVTATTASGCTYLSNTLLAEYPCQFVPNTALLANGSPYFADTNYACPPASILLSLSNAAAFYQWYKDSLLINGATNATYNATETGVYFCKMYNGNIATGNVCSNSTFNKYTLIVKPIIYTTGSATSPANACANGTFTVNFTSNNTPIGSNIQLWESINNGSFVNIHSQLYNGGVISVTINNSNIATVKKYYFTVFPITGSCGIVNNTDTTSTQVLNPSAPTITIASSANNVCQYTNINFTAAYTNGGTSPLIQWYVNGNFYATGNSFNFQPVNGDVITAKLTSSELCANPVLSNPIVMNIITIQTPFVNATVSSLNICAGTSVTFSATTNYNNIVSSSWTKNGIAVSYNSLTYTTSNIQNGDVFQFGVSNSLTGCFWQSAMLSNIITMNVKPLLVPTVSIALNDADNVICKNQLVTFTAQVNNGGLTPILKWYKNDILVFTGTSYTSNTLLDNDKISCQLTTSVDCYTTQTVFSNLITVTVPFVQPVITKDNFDLTTPNRIGSSFVWYLDNNVINDATSNTYRTPVYGSYNVTETYKTCSSTSLPYLMQPLTNQNTSVTLYPNPFSNNRVLAQTTPDVFIKDIIITNSLGQVVSSQYTALSNNMVQIEFNILLANGIYYFIFETDKGRISIKSEKL